MSSAPVSKPVTEWTIRALMEWTERHFQQKGIESPRLEAQLLLAHALECRKTELYTRWDEVIDEGRRARFRDLIRRRLEGCPVQYLLGYREFFLLTLEVTPAVLIPRPETELLVSEALKFLGPLSAPRVLDIGTGSGCIAIAIADRHKGALITAVDVSAEALAVAQRNAARHSVSERIRFVESDLLGALGDEPLDLIISNPPYIAAEEYAALAAQVRDFEPKLALDGGTDGYAIYERLIPQAAARLAPGGALLLEIGFRQEEGVRARLIAAGLQAGSAIRDDQRHPRVMMGKK